MTDESSDRAEQRRRAAAALAEERRSDTRDSTSLTASFRWHHAPVESTRCDVLDACSTGLRIRSAVPLQRGMTGTVTLPDRENRPFAVAWSRKTAEGLYEAGLRFLRYRLGDRVPETG